MSFREMASAVAGTTMAPGRQDALRKLRERIQEDPQDRKRRFLQLIPEPQNKWDKDAVGVWAHIPGFGPEENNGWFQIGYIRNGETYCTFCETTHPAYPKGDPPRCSKCRNTGHDWFERRGTAKKLAQEMAKDPHARFYAVVQEVTGGTGHKENLGCNILICKTIKKEQREAARPKAAHPAQPALPDLVERRAQAPTPAQRKAASKPAAAGGSLFNPTAPNRVYDWDDEFEDA